MGIISSLLDRAAQVAARLEESRPKPLTKADLCELNRGITEAHRRISDLYDRIRDMETKVGNLQIAQAQYERTAGRWKFLAGVVDGHSEKLKMLTAKMGSRK